MTTSQIVDGFILLSRALTAWPAGWTACPTGGLTEAQRRLWVALDQWAQHPASVGPADLTVLFRQVLCQETALQGGTQRLRVPRTQPWPDEQSWLRAGIHAAAHSSNQTFLLEASAWQPSWLGSDQDPAEAVYSGVVRRPHSQVPSDPVVHQVVGHAHYTSAGQREAVRGMLDSAPGSTLLALLPTGTGKSLVAHAPALIQTRAGGTSVVVVPTVVLTKDQERAYHRLPGQAQQEQGAPHDLAYHGGLSPERRQAIRARIRSGEQQIVFTSPESLVGSLASAITSAAEGGLLRALVIDEAHIVSQWGNGFRPDFQAVAGFRRHLLRTCPPGQPFKTLLLTATLPEEALETLCTLFGDPGPFYTVPSVSLRPEPSYWVAQSLTAAVRHERVMEALQHLPRPAILYTTERRDAEEWEQAARQVGYRRVAHLHGQTPTVRREQVLEQWHADQLDLVVATSAFGLGVDHAQVRTVVHACVPETIDRFYQEVGRGGRDGKASVSLLLPTPEDLHKARRLNRTTLIGATRGLERWTLMFANKRRLEDDRFEVALDTLLPDLPGHSDHNEAWNLKTLTLMSRAGLLALDGAPLPSVDDAVDDATVQAQFQRYAKTAVVRVLDPTHLDPKTWSQRVSASRQQTLRSLTASFRLMEDVLQGQRDMADVFAEAYRLRWTSALGVQLTVNPVRACGGCPACRAARRRPYSGLAPTPRPVPAAPVALGPRVAPLLQSGTAWVTYSVPDTDAQRRQWRLTLGRLAEALVRQGVRNVVWPPGEGDTPALQRLWTQAPEQFVFTFQEYMPLSMPELPTLIVHPPGLPLPAAYLDDVPFPRIFLVPEASPHPLRPREVLTSLVMPNYPLALFQSRVL